MILDTIRRAVSRRDSWLNVITGVGLNTQRSGMKFEPQAADYLTRPTLENLFNLDGLAARIVRSVPNHALRQGFTVTTGDTAVDAKLKSRLDELAVSKRARLAWTWGRLYGGGAVFVGADDGQDPREPLNEASIRSVRFLVDVDCHRLIPQQWCVNPFSARFGEPETFLLQRNGSGGGASNVVVHTSRIVRFDGVEVTHDRRLELQGWGDSVLQRPYTELQQVRGAFAAVATLMGNSSQGVFKIKELMTLIAGDKDDTLRRRFEAMALCKSVANDILVDAEGESYERVEVGTMTGLVEVLDRFVNFLSAVSEIPVCVLMGQAPAGLNATGDSEIRSWYDAVAAEREAILQPRLERLVKLLLLAKDGPTQGIEPAGWKVAFAPLWQPTPAELEELRGKVAVRDGMYIDKQVLTPEEVAINRFRADGWSAETSIDLTARIAARDADATEGASQGTAGGDAPGSDHADAVMAIIAKVAAREIPRQSGVALLVTTLGVPPDVAEVQMGEAGRTFFTAPEPGHAAEMDSVKAENAKLKASNAGHVQYTARVIQRAKEGGLELGAFASGPPTVTEEGDDLTPGAVVAVDAPPAPKTDGLTSDGPVAVVVFPLPADAARDIAVKDGTPASELHLTLAMLGRGVVEDEEAARIVEVLKAWAAERAPLQVTLGGVGRFVGTDPAKGDPIYRRVEGVDLAAARDALVRMLTDAGFPQQSEHAYVPHVTLAYEPKGATAPAASIARASVTLDRVALWAGDRRVEVPLTRGE